MLILHRGFMQPAAAWGGGGSLLGRQGGLGPFRGGPGQAAQPQGAGSTHACPLGTAQPSCGAAPRVGLPSPLNTTPHTYLPLPWDSARQQWGSPHPSHLSHPSACLRTLRGPKTAPTGCWGMCCCGEGWQPSAHHHTSSVCRCPCLAACRCASLTLKEQQQLHICPGSVLCGLSLGRWGWQVPTMGGVS